jgi:hypothetical protein
MSPKDIQKCEDAGQTGVIEQKNEAARKAWLETFEIRLADYEVAELLYEYKGFSEKTEKTLKWELFSRLSGLKEGYFEAEEREKDTAKPASKDEN